MEKINQLTLFLLSHHRTKYSILLLTVACTCPLSVLPIEEKRRNASVKKQTRKILGLLVSPNYSYGPFK